MVIINFIDGTSEKFGEFSTLVKWDTDAQWAIFDMGDEATYYYNITFIKSIDVLEDKYE
jgi:hypothetical protein